MTEKTPTPRARRTERQPDRYSRAQQSRIDDVADRLAQLEPYVQVARLSTPSVLPRLVDHWIIELGITEAERLVGAADAKADAADAARAKGTAKA